MHPSWDLPRLKAKYREAEAQADTAQEQCKTRLSEADQKELYRVIRATEEETMAWLFLDKVRLVDAIARYFPSLPIRAIANHATDALEGLKDDCGLVAREDNAPAETYWPVCSEARAPASSDQLPSATDWGPGSMPGPFGAQMPTLFGLA